MATCGCTHSIPWRIPASRQIYKSGAQKSLHILPEAHQPSLAAPVVCNSKFDSGLATKLISKCKCRKLFLFPSISSRHNHHIYIDRNLRIDNFTYFIIIKATQRKLKSPKSNVSLCSRCKELATGIKCDSPDISSTCECIRL
jgi:hypothetical protein